VQGVQLTWFDSFQPGMQFTKNTILFDIFCCYYNLAIIYFTRAMRLGDVDLDTSRKEAMTKAKYAAYLLNEMKEKFYGEFTQVGFHDTQYPHLDMLYNLCMGLIYKCLFNTFKESEFKLGINKIAAISGMAAKYYFKAYTQDQHSSPIHQAFRMSPKPNFSACPTYNPYTSTSPRTPATPNTTKTSSKATTAKSPS
jgi:hypothetical protein